MPRYIVTAEIEVEAEDENLAQQLAENIGLNKFNFTVTEITNW